MTCKNMFGSIESFFRKTDYQKEKKMPKKINSEAVLLSDLPQTGLLRVNQILQFVPISASTWWMGVRDGRFPKPIKLSKRVTVWAVKDIRELIAGRTDFSTPGTDTSVMGSQLSQDVTD